MSKNREEVARELAKLASLMDPSGAEEHIGETKASPVADSAHGSILIHNFNYGSDIVARAAQAPVLPHEDLNPPSLAEVQARAQAVYGDQSHNSDFYPKGLDAMNEMLHGRPSVVASKRKLEKFAAKYGEEFKLVYDIAEELIKRANFDASSIGSARNEGPAIQNRIDSNKNLSSVQSAFRHGPLPEVTSYGAPAFTPAMDTGGFEGSMEVHATRRMANRSKRAGFGLWWVGLLEHMAKDPQKVVNTLKENVLTPEAKKWLIDTALEKNPKEARDLFEKHGIIPVSGPSKEAATRRMAQKKTK